MAKRFTDTTKWDDPWYLDLDPKDKLLWNFILDRCDHAGVWKVNIRLASFMMGFEVNLDHAIETFCNRVHIFDDGRRWFINQFVAFQYGELKENNKPHQSVVKILKSFGLLDMVVVGVGVKNNRGETELRQKILARDKNICCYCDKTFDPVLLQVDHIFPVSKGGETTPENMVASCQVCNNFKHDLLLEEFCLKYSRDYQSIQKTISQRVSIPLLDGAKDKDKDKDMELDKERLNADTQKFYDLYPSSSVKRARIKKSLKDMDKIREVLLTGYPLERAIREVALQEDMPQDLSTFLNNLPDLNAVGGKAAAGRLPEAPKNKSEREYKGTHTTAEDKRELSDAEKKQSAEMLEKLKGK